MIKTQRFFLIFIIFILAGGVSSAEIYSWEDENGVVHYSDTETTTTNESQPGSETQRFEYDPELITEILDEIKDENEEEDIQGPSVELYVTSWCSYCKKAKAFFRSRGIEFTEYDVEKDQAAAQRMQALTKSKSVPFAVINGHSIQGYSTAAYEKALSN
jgi:glutaredoxin-like YruB-family protein